MCMSSCSGWLRDASVPPVTAETCLGTALAALVYSKELSGSGLSSLLTNHTTACSGFILAHQLALQNRAWVFESTSSCNVDAPALCQCPACWPKGPQQVTKLNKAFTPTLRTKMLSSVPPLPSYHKPHLTKIQKNSKITLQINFSKIFELD